METAKPPFVVAVVGCGTVGGATCVLLDSQRQALAERVGREIELRYIVDVNFDMARKLDLTETKFCDDIATVMADDDVELIVELIGGTTLARDIVTQAVTAGKHVVTANKALMAKYGVELFGLARAKGVTISLEASCGGGIPLIRSLNSLLANRIDALYGIVNGTCNYILTEMTQTGQSYDEALADAQRDGLAEADPALDVGGGDSAHKLAILASLAYGMQVDVDQIPTEGIDSLESCDVKWGHELGYVVKLLAIAQRFHDGISLRVKPVFISLEHPLAWISGPFNAVSVYGHATGHTMYYGRGAGGMPTASAVVGDICQVASGAAAHEFASLGVWPDRNAPAVQLPLRSVRSRYYIRMMVDDHPGVLAQASTILGEHNISICSVLQHETRREADDFRPLVITTYRAKEGDLQDAMKRIDALDDIDGPSVVIGIVDEHPEELTEI